MFKIDTKKKKNECWRLESRLEMSDGCDNNISYLIEIIVSHRSFLMSKYQMEYVETYYLTNCELLNSNDWFEFALNVQFKCTEFVYLVCANIFSDTWVGFQTRYYLVLFFYHIFAMIQTYHRFFYYVDDWKVPTIFLRMCIAFKKKKSMCVSEINTAVRSIIQMILIIWFDDTIFFYFSTWN